MVPPEQRPEDLLGSEPVFDSEEARLKRQIAEGEAHVDAMDQALQDFGICAGYPQRRRDWAAELLLDGLDVAGLHLLGRHIEKGTPAGPHKAASILAKTLSDPERWRAMLPDVQRFERARQGRDAEYTTDPDDEPKHHPGESIRQANMAKLQSARDADPQRELKERAICHMRGERWSIAKTAEILGVGEPLVRQWAQEAGISEAKPAPVPGLRRGRKDPKEPSP